MHVSYFKNRIYNTYVFLFFSGKIILFYLIFYAVLTAFFAGMLAVFYQTLDAKKPKWQLESSLIGSNPGKYIDTIRQIICFL